MPHRQPRTPVVIAAVARLEALQAAGRGPIVDEVESVVAVAARDLASLLASRQIGMEWFSGEMRILIAAAGW